VLSSALAIVGSPSPWATVDSPTTLLSNQALATDTDGLPLITGEADALRYNSTFAIVHVWPIPASPGLKPPIWTPNPQKHDN